MNGAQVDPTVIARFWARVQKSDGCWEWIPPRDPRGYGRLRVAEGRSRLAHRLSLELHLDRRLVGDECALHRCDNPPCVRPDHLWVGTRADNSKDCAQKGRTNVKGRPGITNPLAKLTEADVIEARELVRNGAMVKYLAPRYGVSERTLAKAVRGEKWAHIPGGLGSIRGLREPHGRWGKR